MAPKRQAITNNNNRQRRKRCKDKKNNFHSKSIRFGPRGTARVFQRIVKAGCIHTRDNDFDDCLKGSPRNPVKSAKLSSSSFDIHCGGDVPGTTQAINGLKTVERFACASGSGKGTIGIDPKTLRINPLPPHFHKLKAAVMNLSDDVLDPSHKVDCNAMSVKVHCEIPGTTSSAANSATGWHSDVLFNEGNNKPTKNKNSQKPESPALIFAFGGTKSIHFAQTTGGRSEIIPTSQVAFEQNVSRMFVLDGRDEKWKDGEKWVHMSDCPQPGPDNGMIIGFVLRVVQNKQRVVMEDSTLFKKEDNKLFERKRKKHKQGRNHAQQIAKIDDKLNDLCDFTLHWWKTRQN